MHDDRDVVSDRAMGLVLIIVSTPSLQLVAGVGKTHESVGVHAFRAQLAIERLDTAVIRGLTWPPEVQGNRIGISPEIEVARDELAAIVAPDRLGIADLTADPFQRLDNIFAAIGKPSIGCRAKALSVIGAPITPFWRNSMVADRRSGFVCGHCRWL